MPKPTNVITSSEFNIDRAPLDFSNYQHNAPATSWQDKAVEKCFLMQRRIEYVGHILQLGQIHVRNRVLHAVQEMELPKKTNAQLRSFLSL